jgi:hypothetical protein
MMLIRIKIIQDACCVAGVRQASVTLYKKTRAASSHRGATARPATPPTLFYVETKRQNFTRRGTTPDAPEDMRAAHHMLRT